MNTNTMFLFVGVVATAISVISMLVSTRNQKYFLLLYQLVVLVMIFFFMALDNDASHYYWLLAIWLINKLILFSNILSLR